MKVTLKPNAIDVEGEHLSKFTKEYDLITETRDICVISNGYKTWFVYPKYIEKIK